MSRRIRKAVAPLLPIPANGPNRERAVVVKRGDVLPGSVVARQPAQQEKHQ